ncbi:hypothetical protein [Streptomyces sp. NPDC127190]|uniref:hypothetical protein n=1 Tax=unclassified Streptomyces TaxID=2593676 RepID=UPI00363FE2CF
MNRLDWMDRLERLEEMRRRERTRRTDPFDRVDRAREPIYAGLVTEWRAQGRTVPAEPDALWAVAPPAPARDALWAVRPVPARRPRPEPERP